MLATVQGIYRNGHIVLAEVPTDLGDGTPVIVTFMQKSFVDLSSRGIDQAEAADLRAKLAAFAEDWDEPAMEGYDDYETWEAKNQTR